MQIIGHRGACGYEPENTLSSFTKALELDVDSVELDVYALKSGELVVIHDDKVDRTTNGSGYVMDYSFENLRKLDAGKGQKIPTLQEVIESVDKKVSINIELKGLATAKAVAQTITQYKQKGWNDKDFTVSSFNHVELATFHALSPSIEIGALITAIPTDYAAFGSNLGAQSVNLNAEFITPAFVDDARARNLKVFVFTINDQSEALRMKQLGVDGIFSNFPDKVRSYVA